MSLSFNVFKNVLPIKYILVWLQISTPSHLQQCLWMWMELAEFTQKWSKKKKKWGDLGFSPSQFSLINVRLLASQERAFRLGSLRSLEPYKSTNPQNEEGISVHPHACDSVELLQKHHYLSHTQALKMRPWPPPAPPQHTKHLAPSVADDITHRRAGMSKQVSY